MKKCITANINHKNIWHMPLSVLTNIMNCKNLWKLVNLVKKKNHFDKLILSIFNHFYTINIIR